MNDERSQLAIQELLEAQGQAARAIAFAQQRINELEQECAELRSEVAVKHIEIFTEAEFAERLKVSSATIKRARKEGRIVPLELGSAGSTQCIRYSSEHLERVSEIFKPRLALATLSAGRRRRTG